MTGEPESRQDPTPKQRVQTNPQVVGGDLDGAYHQMAQQEAREAEALAWAEDTAGDVADEAR